MVVILSVKNQLTDEGFTTEEAEAWQRVVEAAFDEAGGNRIFQRVEIKKDQYPDGKVAVIFMPGKGPDSREGVAGSTHDDLRYQIVRKLTEKT